MDISCDYYTGHLVHVQTVLRRRVRVFTKKWYWVKVGITNNPNTRANQHIRNDPDWERMVVLWKSSSVTKIRQAESLLINYLWEHEGLDNMIDGGGGRQARVGPYFLYVLLSARLSDD